MIKFRVWDDNQKVMMIPRDIQTDSDGNIDYIEATGPNGEYGEGDSDLGNLDAFKLEQFIGINDINGKDMYIGDIVKSFSNVNAVSMVPIIGELVSVTSIGEPGVFLKPVGPHLIEPKISVLFSQYEVIGNIHTNPELMEEDSDD